MASPFNIAFGYGQQRLYDTAQQFFQAGHPVWLRVRNFPDVQNSATQPAAALGFNVSPTGQATGTTDILITPQPAVESMSASNIARSMGKLRLRRQALYYFGVFP